LLPGLAALESEGRTCFTSSRSVPHFFETVALIDHFHHVTRDAQTYQTALLNRWRRRGGCAHAFFYSPRQVGKERIGGEAQQKV